MKHFVSAKLLLLLVAGLIINTLPSRAMILNITYDASVTNLSGPVTNAAAVEGAFAAAAQLFENQYTNDITVNLTVYWGSGGPFTSPIELGESSTQFIGLYSYTDLTNALFAARTSPADNSALASLPPSDPIAGDQWWVPMGEAKALGLPGVDPNDTTTDDGAVGFASNQPYTFSPTNRAVAGKFDLIGVMEHEISEALGRTSDLNEGGGGYIPFDLFRFTAPGVRNFQLTDVNAALVYFSVDDGVTPLKYYYTNYTMGDVQDWQSSTPPDSFDAFVSSGHQLVFSYVDSLTLDILGYNSPVVSAPHLAGSHLTNGTFQISFTDASNGFFSVFSSTNATLKATNWTLVGTPTQISPGLYQFIDSHPTNRLRVYRVSSP